MKTVTQLYNTGEILTNDVGLVINDYVKKKKTKLFDNEQESYSYAMKNNTYNYEVYCNGRSVGYAVPK